ncbi:MAG: hypothetical protein EXS37_12175 [Opitutus sp.]|nr:hypothetical protein [Opitutus sp.]
MLHNTTGTPNLSMNFPVQFATASGTVCIRDDPRFTPPGADRFQPPWQSSTVLMLITLIGLRERFLGRHFFTPASKSPSEKMKMSEAIPQKAFAAHLAGVRARFPIAEPEHHSATRGRTLLGATQPPSAARG